MDQYCEVCGGYMGTMSHAAWDHLGRTCDACYENGVEPSYHDETKYGDGLGYAYASGQRDYKD